MNDDPFAPIVRNDPSAVMAGPTPSANPVWKTAAAALDEHERGLLARMTLPVIAFFVVFMIAQPNKLEWLATATVWLVPVGVLVATVFAIRGALRFAQLPAAAPARVAAVLMGVALAVDAWMAVVRIDDSSTFGDSRSRSLQLLLGAAGETVLVLIAIFLMLWAFQRVARALGRPEARKTASACAYLMATLTFVVVPYMVVSMRDSGSPSVIYFMLALLIGVIGMVLYMRTVRTLVEQLDERAAGTLVSLE